MLLESANPATANPALARGLRRAREQRAPCEPVAWTPLPDPVDAVHLLALLTRVRATRVDAGEISPQRLYDVRAFKSAYAELGYLRTLTRRQSGGTIATSMPQLVAGLARLHPRWKIEGDKFADRDRHHSAVRRRLRDLHDMGLLSWRVGVDADGEDARTELELRPAPEVTSDELAAATAQLERWQARYGEALNTGSSTGIRNAADHGRPLTASERHRRGIARTRAQAQSRREPSNTNSGPHCVAPPSSENNLLSTTNPTTDDHLCGLRTRVTRAHGSDHAKPPTASNPSSQTTSLTTAAKASTDPLATVDMAAVLERVVARTAARQPVLELIARQAAQRAREVTFWTLERAWALKRIQEAWVVWRHGATYLAEYSAAAAGPLEPDDHARLRRAVARYERYRTARPTGFPELGMTALAHLGAIAAARDAKPVTLHYAIRRLDQLSRRMRAIAKLSDPRVPERQAARVRRRLFPAADPGLLRFSFRIESSPWPSWVALDDAGAPILVDGDLTLAAGHDCWAPAPSDPWYIQTLRDAQLLAGWSPAEGRTEMASGNEDLHAQPQRRALPGPYVVPQDRRTRPEPEDLELTRRAGIALGTVQALKAAQRDLILAEVRADQAHRDAHDRASWWRTLTDATNPPSSVP
jgi:hypothetical protein